MTGYSKYKYSGFSWIGDIPEHWSVKRTKYVASLYNGDSLNDDQKNAYSDFSESDETLPYIASKDIEKDSCAVDYVNGTRIPRKEKNTNGRPFAKAPSGSSLLCIEGGSAGRKRCIIDREVNFVNKLCCFVPKINRRFLFYYICSHPYWENFKQNLQGMIGGVTVTKLATFPIPVPSDEEQNAIADYLDTECKKIDDLIAKEEKRIKLIEETKLSIISRVITKGLAPEATMKNSGIPWVGQVPCSWTRHRIKYDLTRSAAGVWGDEEKGNEDDIVCYRIADYDYLKGVLDNDNPTVRNIPAKDRQGRLLKKGDLLIEKSGGGDIWPVGRVVRYNYDLEAVSSNFIHSVTVDEQKIDPDFLYYYFRFLYANKVNLLYFNQTTGIQNLKVSAYLSQSLFAPELTEQKEIVDYLNKECSSYDTAIEKANKQINLLKEYKQSLITEVVTGKRKVC